MRPVTPEASETCCPRGRRARGARRARSRDAFAAWGYGLVETPVVEESRRARGRRAGSLEGTAFRLVDLDGRLLALRPEMTVPIARLVASRLAGRARPAPPALRGRGLPRARVAARPGAAVHAGRRRARRRERARRRRRGGRAARRGARARPGLRDFTRRRRHRRGASRDRSRPPDAPAAWRRGGAARPRTTATSSSSTRLAATRRRRRRGSPRPARGAAHPRRRARRSSVPRGRGRLRLRRRARRARRDVASCSRRRASPSASRVDFS